MPKAKPFTSSEKQFILDNFEKMTIHEMAAGLNRSEGSVKTWSLKLGLRRNRYFVWTPERVAELRQLYPDTKSEIIARNLGCKLPAVYGKARNLNLKKSEVFLNSTESGRLSGEEAASLNTRFKKGQKPWSFGKKIGTCGRSAESFFQKGSIPHNIRKVGDIVPVSCSAYLKIKIAEPNKWKFLHRYYWEEINGDVPNGFVLFFKDQNPKNCAIGNLELISRKELRLRCSVYNYPDELKEAIRILGLLKRKINRRTKNAEK